MYKFFYTYRQEIYGVLKHQRKVGILSVELIRTNEKEEIKTDWFIEQIKENNIDIAYEADYLENDQ